MKTRLFALLILVILNGSQIFSQTEGSRQPTQEPVRKILYYTFTGPASGDELRALQNEVLLITDVTEVKTECKAEKKMAQLRIVFIERKKMHEGDKDFDIAGIKKLILKYNYTPGDFKIENAEQ